MKKSILNAAFIVILLSGLVFSASPARADFQQSIECSAVTKIPKIECDALFALYNGTGGPTSWTDHSNWFTNNDPDTWYGVGVFTDTDDGFIVGTLELTGNQLTGTLPPEMGNLTHLVQLDLDYNQLSDSIPPQLGGKPDVSLGTSSER